MKMLKLAAASMAAALAFSPAAMAEGQAPLYICAYYVGGGDLIEALSVDPASTDNDPVAAISDNAPDGADSGVLYRWDESLRPTDRPVTVDFTKAADESGAFLAPYVTEEMCADDFWHMKDNVSRRVIMTEDEIAEYNRAILDTPATNTTDLKALDSSYNGRSMADAMAGFASPNGLYIDGEPVDESYYEAIRENIRLADVSEDMELKYGVAVNRTVMKAYPYDEFLSDSPDDPEWDNLVSAPIYVNEPLAIYFTTADGRFTLVKSQCCSGWAPTEDIAVCEDKSEWERVTEPENFLLITGEEIYLEPSYDDDLDQKMLTMGTALELVTVWPGTVAERLAWNNYVVKLPARDADGRYYQKLAMIPMNRDVNVGYLPYTSANVVTQALKQLGNRYGWGGMMDSNDCSSYVREVYRCFGIMLPRNTTWQAAVPTGVTSLSGMTNEEKTDFLSGAPAGTVLIFPGHEMLYLGEDGGRYYTVNDVSSIVSPAAPEEGIIKPRSVIVNDLSTLRANGTTWLDNLTYALTIE